MEAGAPLQRAVAVAAGAALLLPLAGLTLVGISERAPGRFPLSGGSLVTGALATAVAGVALGVASWMGSAGVASARKRAIAGVVLSLCVLAVVGAGSVAGAESAERASHALRSATDAAVRDFPGWNGGAVVDGANVYAIEVDARAELTKMLLVPYGEPFRVLLFGVDNRAGVREVVLDVEGAEARIEDGAPSSVSSIRREVRIAHAVGNTAVVEAQLEPVRVAPGERYDGAFALFAPATTFQKANAVAVRVDGAMRELHGRYFTLREKRFIDQQGGGR